MIESKNLLEELKSIIKQGGKILIELYNKDYPLEEKEAWLPVTEADLVLEKFFIEKLKKYKDFGILAEEDKENKSRLNYNYVFILDPLDGTKDFINKTGDFSIILGVAQKGKIKIGLVYQPITDIMYYAIEGQGAFMEKDNQISALQVSRETDFRKMKILLSRYHLAEKELNLIDKLGLQKESMGSAGLKICTIAKGDAHIYLNSSPKTGEWDIAGAKIILEEAGGMITDIEGNELEFNKQSPFNINGFLVSNKVKHKELI